MNDTLPLPELPTAIHNKWGPAALAGWMAVPDVLLKNQHKLSLTPTEMLVLLNILSFWWTAEGLPYPRLSTLARRMNVTNRTVQRCMSVLEEKGLIQRKTSVGADGTERIVMDPQGLVKQLSQLTASDPAFLYRKQRKEEHDGVAGA